MFYRGSSRMLDLSAGKQTTRDTSEGRSRRTLSFCGCFRPMGSSSSSSSWEFSLEGHFAGGSSSFALIPGEMKKAGLGAAGEDLPLERLGRRVRLSVSAAELTGG